MSRKLTLQEMMMRGGIGKSFCIKHYNRGIIKTKFPDMTKIIASGQQRKCRNIFKEAVAYAKTEYTDPVKREKWTKRAIKKHHVINYIIKEYMLAAKEASLKRQEIATIIIRKCFTPGSGRFSGSGRLHAVRPLSNAFKRLTALSRPDT